MTGRRRGRGTTRTISKASSHGRQKIARKEQEARVVA
jgi:hypothetical protein